MKKFKFLKGFTLIEILVVISIIGLLAAMGAVSYTSAQKKARDAKRKNDVRAVSNALEQYYVVCGNVYVTPGNSINCSSPAISIMPTVPRDPKNTPYVCSGCTNASYNLCANGMEAESPTGYCVRNQQ